MRPSMQYNAKMFRIDPDSTQDLIYALEDYTLDRETIEDIHEELPKQQGYGQTGSVLPLLTITPQIAVKQCAAIRCIQH